MASAYNQYMPNNELADSIDPGPYKGVITKGSADDKLLLTCPDSFVKKIVVQKNIVPASVWAHMEQGCTPVYFIVGKTKNGETEARKMESAIPNGSVAQYPTVATPYLPTTPCPESRKRPLEEPVLSAFAKKMPQVRPPPVLPTPEAAQPVAVPVASIPLAPVGTVSVFMPWFAFGECFVIAEQGRRCFEAYRGTVHQISDDGKATVISDSVSAMLGCPVVFEQSESKNMKLREEVEFIICATKNRSIKGKIVPPGGIFSGTIMIIGEDKSGVILSPEAESVAGISPTVSADDVEAYDLKVGDFIKFHIILDPQSESEILALVVPGLGRYRGYYGTNNNRPVLHHQGLKLKFGHDLQMELVPSSASIGDEFEFSLALNESGFSIAQNIQPTGRNNPIKALRNPRLLDSLKLGNDLSLYLRFKGIVESICSTHIVISSMDLVSRTCYKDGSVVASLEAVPEGLALKSNVLFTLHVSDQKPRAENVVNCLE